MARIVVVTAFPDMVRACLSASIIGRATERGLLDISVVDARDYADGPRAQLDDYAYGGGGMVIMAEPLRRAVEAAASREDRYVVCPGPQGTPLRQEIAEDLAREARRRTLVIVCGHYEGIDERFIQKYVDLEVSLGDFVLTGGEIPALAIIDSLSRLLDGVVGRSEAVSDDSFYSGMFDHPHYTRPPEWDGMSVPQVLMGGNDAEIAAYRNEVAVRRTAERRPDVIGGAAIMPYLKHGAYAVQLHYPVLDRNGEASTTAITGMDVHDIARACRTYGIKKYLIVTPLAAQREIVKKIAAHWRQGVGAEFCPDRSGAMELVKTFASFGRALGWIEERERSRPFTIATTARDDVRAKSWSQLKAELLHTGRPPVFLFGTGHGLHSSVIDAADRVMSPIMGSNDGYNHLSVRSAASIVFDRFFGFR